MKHGIYIAAPWICRTAAVEARAKFENAGLVVSARWMIDHEEVTERNACRDQALADLDAIADSGLFVLLNLAKSEGKATELGYAYALNIPCCVVGSRDGNLFYHLPRVVCAETIADAIGWADRRLRRGMWLPR